MLSKIEFKDIFDKHFDEIRSFVYYKCGDTDLASDIAQDVFMKVWEKRANLDGENIRALLYRMANHCVIDNYRKNNSHINFEKNMVPNDAYSLSPEDEMVYKEVIQKYSHALETMNDTQRTVFLMSRNDNLKYNEIAERLDISAKAVEKRMSAALKHLREIIL